MQQGSDRQKLPIQRFKWPPLASAAKDWLGRKFRYALSGNAADKCQDQPPPGAGSCGITVADMGCGKGYLTFAARDWLRRKGWGNPTVRGIEARPELVELSNRVASEHGFTGLSFEAGTVATTTLGRVDVLIALHACDTATDDAIAKGIQAGASLILVAPCCHKELRPQLRPPAYPCESVSIRG